MVSSRNPTIIMVSTATTEEAATMVGSPASGPATMAVTDHETDETTLGTDVTDPATDETTLETAGSGTTLGTVITLGTVATLETVITLGTVATLGIAMVATDVTTTAAVTGLAMLATSASILTAFYLKSLVLTMTDATPMRMLTATDETGTTTTVVDAETPCPMMTNVTITIAMDDVVAMDATTATGAMDAMDVTTAMVAMDATTTTTNWS